MSDGWEITTNAKTKYVLEWEETFNEYDQRESTISDGSYKSIRKKIKEFMNFDELHEYYLKFEHNKGIKNVIGYKMEWLDLNKKPKLEV